MYVHVYVQIELTDILIHLYHPFCRLLATSTLTKGNSIEQGNQIAVLDVHVQYFYCVSLTVDVQHLVICGVSKWLFSYSVYMYVVKHVCCITCTPAPSCILIVFIQ